MNNNNPAAMNPRNFSLNLLRTFDVAARLSSFKCAAEELFITPSAVSQQIKELEGHLGIQLFERSSQGLVLSEAGQFYWQGISPALLSLTRSTQSLRQKYHQEVLRVSLIPPIAHRVIFPQLSSFQKLHPEIKLMLDTSETNIDLLRSSTDLAIRFDEPPWTGCEHHKLLDIVIQPVFNRVTDQEFALSQHPENIVHAPLIHITHHPEFWSQYLAASNLGLPLSQEALHVSDYQGAITAVLSYGVAIVLYPLEQSYVESHQLVAPPALAFPHGAIYAVAAQGRLQEPKIQRFLAWLEIQLQSF